MALNLPTEDEFDAELDRRPADDLSAEKMLKDSSWGFKFTETLEVDPADVHSA